MRQPKVLIRLLLPRTRGWLLIIERPHERFYFTLRCVPLIFSKLHILVGNETELELDEIALLWLLTYTPLYLLFGPEESRRRKTFIMPVLVLIVLLDLQLLFNWLLVGKLNETLLHVQLFCCAPAGSGTVVHILPITMLLDGKERERGRESTGQSGNRPFGRTRSQFTRNIPNRRSIVLHWMVVVVFWPTSTSTVDASAAASDSAVKTPVY